jgi:farnesyl-diphosphate farnesyltransferase
MSLQQNPSLNDLLRETSRSFYLTLRVLPAKIRPQIGLAYLLARTTDTIADTAVLPLDQRLDALQDLRERIMGNPGPPPDFGELAQRQDWPAERMLLERCGEALALLGSFEAADRQLIREVLRVIISGQELDLRRFASASAENIISLADDKDLDDYTYRVAGCVGEFWTKICRAHLFPGATVDEAMLLTNGVRFGKGLQLVNILRDLPVDLRHGRCYLPAGQLSAAGLAIGDLLEPRNEPKFRPLYERYLAVAEGHLTAGWAYTNALPGGGIRLRLACAWPILIGMKTVAMLRAGNVLDPEHRIKVSRPEVKRLILRSVLYYPWPGAWRRLVSSPGTGAGSLTRAT